MSEFLMFLMPDYQHVMLIVQNSFALISFKIHSFKIQNCKTVCQQPLLKKINAYFCGLKIKDSCQKKLQTA